MSSLSNVHKIDHEITFAADGKNPELSTVVLLEVDPELPTLVLEPVFTFTCGLVVEGVN